MKIAIIGKRGFVGSALLKKLQQSNHHVIGADHRNQNQGYYVDLIYPSLNNLPISGLDYAVIAGGWTNIKSCEENPSASYKCNVLGTLELVNILQDKGICPIVFSSDCIFSGEESHYLEASTPSPINHYARQKAELESALLSGSNENFLILRCSKIYSTTKGDSSLIDEMAKRLSMSLPIRAAYDQIFSPIHIQETVLIIEELMSLKARGIYNVAGRDSCSRFELATAIAHQMNASKECIERISIDALDEPFKRSKNTTLCTDKLYSEISTTPRPLKDAIKQLAENYVPLLTDSR